MSKQMHGISISGTTRLAGVIGWPVTHTLSPQIHNYWARCYNLNACYVPLPVAPGCCEEAVRGLVALGFSGANVTVPHKRAVIAACDDLTDLAAKLDSVNTLTVQPDGRVLGDSTDGAGLLASLAADCPNQFADIQARGGRIVILGAGGAARAIAFSCAAALNVEIVICNRTLSAASDLVEALKAAGHHAEAQPWAQRSACLKDADVLINATSLGMTGKAPLEIDLKPLQSQACVADIVYAPLTTDLLTSAAQLGHATSEGLGMLLHQARPAFQAWFGILPDVDPQLRSDIEATLGA